MKRLALLLCVACAGAPPRPAAPRDELQDLLVEVLRFPTVAGNTAAHAAQKEWLLSTAARLGFVARDQGPVTEIELPGPAGAPVLGLVVHGDVQPVDDHWSFPPFAGTVKDGVVYGRGAADDKGPLVQALLAMRAVADAERTMTVRLLVGSDEESGSSDMKAYLAAHEPPAYSLVLDSEFPAVVGEKAWDGLTVTALSAEREATKPWKVVTVSSGLGPSIVPDEARLVLRWRSGAPEWEPLRARLVQREAGPDIRVETFANGNELQVVTHGRAAHGGVNLRGGRNALVALARIVEGELAPGGADDLLAFARLAGQDFGGSALNLPAHAAPGWGGYSVNVAMLGEHSALAPEQDGKLTLTINVRRPPPLTAAQSRALLEVQVRSFAARTGAPLVTGGYFADEPLVFDREAKLVRRLMEDFARESGTRLPPAISGGGTYAKRLPRAIAFGMWFPDKPYPGHDVDEKVTLADLHRGLDVLTGTLRDLVTHPPLHDPFSP